MITAVLLYSRLAENYFDIEAVSRNFPGELGNLRSYLRSNQVTDVIDVGCGSGEHAGGLQRLGFHVEGLDSSIEMVQVARERFGHARFHQGDMKTYRSERIFDAALCLFGSFDYLLADTDVRVCLSNLHGMIRPRGVFILEVWNADPLRQIVRKPMTPVSEVRSRGKRIARDRGFARISDNPFLVQVNYMYHLEGEELPDKHTMRAYRSREIVEFVEQAGFRVELIASGLGGAAFTSRSNRIVLFMRSA